MTCMARLATYLPSLWSADFLWSSCIYSVLLSLRRQSVCGFKIGRVRFFLLVHDKTRRGLVLLPSYCSFVPGSLLLMRPLFTTDALFVLMQADVTVLQ